MYGFAYTSLVLHAHPHETRASSTLSTTASAMCCILKAKPMESEKVQTS